MYLKIKNMVFLTTNKLITYFLYKQHIFLSFCSFFQLFLFCVILFSLFFFSFFIVCFGLLSIYCSFFFDYFFLLFFSIFCFFFWFFFAFFFNFYLLFFFCCFLFISVIYLFFDMYNMLFFFKFLIKRWVRLSNIIPNRPPYYASNSWITGTRYSTRQYSYVITFLLSKTLKYSLEIYII